MTRVARGQAVEMTTWPPSSIVHVCWIHDAVQRIDCGHGNVWEESAVIVACGAYAALEDVHETEAPVDCMTCLVRYERYDQGTNEDSPD